MGYKSFNLMVIMIINARLRRTLDSFGMYPNFLYQYLGKGLIKISPNHWF
jgi:hypothetical protein